MSRSADCDLAKENRTLPMFACEWDQESVFISLLLCTLGHNRFARRDGEIGKNDRGVLGVRPRLLQWHWAPKPALAENRNIVMHLACGHTRDWNVSVKVLGQSRASTKVVHIIYRRRCGGARTQRPYELGFPLVNHRASPPHSIPLQL